ncbi:MAG: hypothetical protein QNJ97_14530 [Myxococcota bacterium]|nr:hypothetical protein [Myxococcota bacterium]
MDEARFEMHIPTEVLDVCQCIADAGEQVYVVGGAIRDLLAGRDIGDIDLATSATPHRVMGLFDRVIPTGIAYGTVTVLAGEHNIEVTTLRGEANYADGRHPNVVTYLTDIEADLARRDFTVNAMAWDPIQRVLIDPFQGSADLAGRVLRAVGDPKARFIEDGLRVLRAARFAATLAFKIEPKTMAAMSAAAPALKKVSEERKRNEFIKIIMAKLPSKGLYVMARAKLLPHILTPLAHLQQSDRASGLWEAACHRIDAAPARLPVRLAALFFDASGPSGTTPGATDDVDDRVELARQWLTFMRFDKKTVQKTCRLLGEMSVEDPSHWGDADVRRFIRQVGRDAVDDLLALLQADATIGHRSRFGLDTLGTLKARVASEIQNGAPLTATDLAVSGRELMDALALSPGPIIGRLIDALVDFAIEHPEYNTPPRLFQYARDWLKDVNP